jgi:precorrin-3B C17-methyltransferase
MKGKVTAVGFGPGGREDMTIRADRAISDADIVTGYTTYVNLIKDFYPGKAFKSTGMRSEVERCRLAIQDALTGKSVAMVCSGDSGIYGMAGLIYQLAESMDADVDIDVVPGVTAASTAAAVLGAPLMHDLSLISLSDYLTPLDLIMKRVDRAAESDMVICLYNPKSNQRDYLGDAADIIMRHRSPDTAVGIVREAGRSGQTHWTTTLGDLAKEDVDMLCTVIVGNSKSYVSDGKMITPRGYEVG